MKIINYLLLKYLIYNISKSIKHIRKSKLTSYNISNEMYRTLDEIENHLRAIRHLLRS